MTSARSRRSRPLAAPIAALAVLLGLTLVATGCAPLESAPLAGDAVPAAAAVASTAAVSTIVVDGLERSYRLQVPVRADSDAPLPLLLVVHGAGGSAERAELATGMTQLADANGFIVAYPQGTQAADIPGEFSWNAGFCCGAPVTAGIDDVGYITALLADIEASHPVDPDRIYIAGFSNGGMLANRLACELDGVFAGIAVVAGALNVAECAAPAVTSVLLVHGTGDQTVPYNGGPTNERSAARFGQWSNTSVQDATDYWAARGGCAPGPVSTVKGAVTGAVTTAVWQECDEDASLSLVTIDGGGHIWPILAESGFDASPLIVERLGLGAGEVSLAR